MKRIALIIGMLVMSTGIYSQITTLQQPFRVVVVSPNYPNAYPRFNTLQATYNAIKDSASVTTGKYFIVNIVTKSENITDYSSQWKDSLVSRDPYVKVVSFGQAINDSVLGVTVSEFTLVAGILGLNSLTAGDGLSFPSHTYKVNTKYPILITSDTVTVQLNDSNFVSPTGTSTKSQYVTLKFSTNSGLTYSANGIEVQTQYPIIKRNDSLTIQLNDSNFIVGDATSRTQNVTLKLKDNSLHYTADGLGVNYTGIDLDSGLIGRVTGLSVNTDGLRLGYNSGKKLTILESVAGDGLSWSSNALKLNIGVFNGVGSQSQNILDILSDSLIFNYDLVQFENDPIYGLQLKLDSGLSGLSNVKVELDYPELQFKSNGQIETAPTLWGDGLIKSGDAGKVVVNEFAKVENDTVKIKTSYTLLWYDDSLKSSMDYVEPFDSTGVPVLTNGKLLRVTYTYQLSSGNDTVVTTTLNTTINKLDKLRLVWLNGLSAMRIQKWTLSTHSWANITNLSFNDFADSKWRIIMELYAEAQ